MYVFLCFFCMPRRLRAPGVTEGPRRGPVGKGCMVRMVRGTCAHVVGARYFLGLAVMQVLCGDQAMAQMCGDRVILGALATMPNWLIDLWGPSYSWGSQSQL